MSVTPCLWFNGNAEEAVSFYVSLVPNSRIVETSRQEGKALMVVFELDGARYQALNGPMAFPFSEAAPSNSRQATRTGRGPDTHTRQTSRYAVPSPVPSIA